jgi:hypothetical protein
MFFSRPRGVFPLYTSVSWVSDCEVYSRVVNLRCREDIE